MSANEPQEPLVKIGTIVTLSDHPGHVMHIYHNYLIVWFDHLGRCFDVDFPTMEQAVGV